MCLDDHVAVQKAKVDGHLGTARVNFPQSKIQNIYSRMLKLGTTWPDRHINSMLYHAIYSIVTFFFNRQT